MAFQERGQPLRNHQHRPCALQADAVHRQLMVWPASTRQYRPWKRYQQSPPPQAHFITKRYQRESSVLTVIGHHHGNRAGIFVQKNHEEDCSEETGKSGHVLYFSAISSPPRLCAGISRYAINHPMLGASGVFAHGIQSMWIYHSKTFTALSTRSEPSSQKMPYITNKQPDSG